MYHINDTAKAPGGPNPCGGAVRPPRGLCRVYSKVIDLSLRAVELLSALIDPTDTRIRQLPNFILVFGGPLGHPIKSARQLFLNWIAINRADLSMWMRNPEDYKDWHSFNGYQNLIDFERDAVCLTRAVGLFSESAGSHAELGAFCMDPVLSERLFVVISEEHYNAGSFIAHGPIKKIEHIREDSVCTVKFIESSKIEAEIPAIVQSLDAKLEGHSKSMNFDPTRARDRFLLVADLIDLFSAITVTEIVELCELLGFKTNVPQIKSIFEQLARFGIVSSVKKTTQRYYVPTEERFSFLDYQSVKGAASFDRLRFKTKVCLPWLSEDKKRHEAYRDVHGVDS